MGRETNLCLLEPSYLESSVYFRLYVFNQRITNLEIDST